MTLDKVDEEINRLMDAEDFNDNDLDFDYSDAILAKEPSHSEPKNKRKNEESDLEALQRTLIERKIVLCNLQIDIARRQLEAFDKPLPASES